MSKWMVKHRIFLATILLTLIFVILKFTGIIVMHWVWMLSPLWIPFILAVLAAFILWIAQ